MTDTLQNGAAEAAPQAPLTPEQPPSPATAVVAPGAQPARREVTDEVPRDQEPVRGFGPAWPRDRIVPSKTNPRKRFSPEALAELADSIKKHGILQTVLCRPLPADPENTLEIIAGERRWRAAGIAGLADIPVKVIHVDDLEMLELQIIENLQRQDLHELEEAESYEALLEAHKGDADYNVDQIAAKVGKSRAYVYARQAFYDGKLNASTALLLARIPVADLQQKALEEITEAYNGPMAYREAAQHVQRNYMLRLDQAKFKISDATLVPSAGACGECPKRTGANPDLFSDVGHADVCTDPTCFATKKQAHAERLRQAALETGLKVIAGAEAKKVKPYSYSDELVGYVRPEDRCWQVDGNKTYAKLLGKDAPAPVMIEDPVLLRWHPALQPQGQQLAGPGRPHVPPHRVIQPSSHWAAQPPSFEDHTMSESITIERTRVHVPAGVASNIGALLTQLATAGQDEAFSRSVRVTQAPSLGRPWPGQGGVYGGLMRGRGDQPDYQLILPTDPAAYIKEIAWGPTGHQVDGADSDWDGLSNTKALIADAKAHPAAQWAAGLRIEDGGKVFTDLYLPAPREGLLLAANVPELFAKGWHWLSKQCVAHNAWIQHFSDGFQSYGDKDSSWQARAVRRLPIIR